VTAADVAAFWIDYDDDRQNTSNGVSRYSAYGRRSSMLAESWDGTWDDPQVGQARFAEAAWATATTPVMSPGFVRCHPRVISAAVQFNAWDATLNGSVQLVTPWPHALASFSDWRRDVWWQDWPAETLGGVRWREPYGHELTGHAYLMASAWLLFPLRAPAGVPPAPSGPDDRVEAAAREAVATLVRAMNAVVIPVIETLERS
jgi:hypothetical protein